MPTRRTASYTRLSPGNYQFQVVACNDAGIWNKTGASLPLVMLPYFWETKWFLAGCGLGVLGVLGSTVRYVVKRRLQRRLERAERENALERERTRIAKDIHAGLGARLMEIAVLSELARHSDAPPDEVDADMDKISTKARSLTQTMDEIVWAVDPQNDTLDRGCVERVLRLAVADLLCQLRGGKENIQHSTFNAKGWFL